MGDSELGNEPPICQGYQPVFWTREATVVSLPSAAVTSQKALGLPWGTISDKLTFHFEPADKRNARRDILPTVSFLLDPLELVALLCLLRKQVL